MSTAATAREGHIFLSHSGADTEAAREFAEILRRQGLPIWFDQDDLHPGDRWMATLEQAILNSSGMIVYIGRLGVQAFVDREVRLGLLRNTQDPSAFRFIPVLGEGADAKALPPFLLQHQWVDLQDRRHAPERIQKLVQAIKAGSPSEGSIIASDYWVHHSPFRSLQAFEPDDSWLFFGRDRETDELLAALNDAPLLAVVGNSGCGKSSLVRGGLIPALRHRRSCSESSWLDSWRIAVFRPTASPFDFLAETLPNQLAADMCLRERAEFIAYCRQKLPSTSGALRDVLCALPGATSRTRFLLVVDQFEEIFTVTNDPNVRQRYIDSLLLAARTEGAVPVHLVLVLRADFYGRCLEHADLSRSLQLNLYNVPHMTVAQSREAIENRLALAMSRAEPGLVSSMLAEVGSEPANLALLEHALGQLWIKCGGCPCTLTNLAYEEIGRLRGAVGRHADLVYKKLSEEQKFLAQRIFVELVHLGHGVEDTRRRVDKDDLLHLGERVQAERLLGELASERLISISAQGEKSFVEVSHDALIREWPTLRHWLESGREDIQLGRHFLEAAEEWQRVNQDAGALLQGTRLVQGEEWLGKHSDVNPLLRKFLQTSIEVERAKELRQAFRTKRNWLMALALVLSLAIIAAWGAWEAQKQRDAAQAPALAAWAATSLQEDPERSLILGLYSWGKQRAMVPGLEDILHASVLQSLSRLTLRGHQDYLYSVAWSPDGTRLATASGDHTAKIWEAKTGCVLLTLHHQGPVRSVAWSPDGTRLATASDDHTAKIWEVKTGRVLLTLNHQGLVWSIAWSPDGTRLATASYDKTAKVWDSHTGQELLTLIGHQREVTSVAWSPDGSRLATGSWDQTAKVWEANTGRELSTLKGHSNVVWSISWSPDMNRLATASDDHTARIWEVGTGRELLTLRGHDDALWSIAWSPNGSQLATASYDRTAKVWEASSGRELFTLRGHQGGIRCIAWSPDGTRVATASGDLTATVWEAGMGRELVTIYNHRGWDWGIAWSPDGNKLATASDNDTAKVWDAKTGSELFTLPHQGSVRSVAWSPDGARLATASDDHTARIWESATRRELLTLRGHKDILRSVAWSRDGGRLATASADGTAKVWNAETGHALLTLCCHQGSVVSVTWSPDGIKLATAGDDGMIRIWDAVTGRELLSVKDQQGRVHCVAWSPDGTRLATAVINQVNIYEAESGHALVTLSGHRGDVWSVAWSPKENKLATGSEDQTIKLWDASTGNELLTVHGHQGSVWSVAWSPDGKQLSSSSMDRTVQVFVTDQNELLHLVHSRITRELTTDECRRYLSTDKCPALPNAP